MLSDMDYLVNIWQSDEDREAELLRWAIKKARDSERNNEHFWPVDYSTLRLLDDDAGGEVQAVANASVMTDIVGDLFGD